MQDPAFKRVFRHPASIERLVRAYAPERAGIVDFGTLEPLDAERVGEAMVRRYPDMMWIARVRGGSDRVLILVEFQGLPDPTMPLRMAVYELLTLQELVGRMPAVGDWRSVEVLSFVVHHGRGHWRAPRRLERLFERLRPGRYRVVSRGSGAPPAVDLARAVLDLERDRSPEGTLAAVRALEVAAGASGEEYDRFMARCVGEMLVSTERITRAQLREARTMAQVKTEYQRNLERYGRDWFRRGRDEGMRAGRDEGIRRARVEQAEMLCRMVRARFGVEVAGELAELLGGRPDPARLAEAAGAVIECATGEEFRAWVRASQAE